MAASSPKQVNKLAVIGVIISLIGLVWTFLSVVYFTNLFSPNEKPVVPQSNDSNTDMPAAVSTPPIEEKEDNFDIPSFYNKVKEGQSRATVMAEASKQPNSCSKNNVEGYGEIEYCRWYKSNNGEYASMTVTFVNQVVDGVSKVGF